MLNNNITYNTIRIYDIKNMMSMIVQAVMIINK